MRSAASNTDWVASLSPWPEEFGLERMRALLAALGEPQAGLPAIHVVGTNGKTTATLTAEAGLRREGLYTGATISPHVRGWEERIVLDGVPADFDAAIGLVRDAAEAIAATQFETITAAALALFAEAAVDAAVVEAGLGGRLDATNVLDAPVVLLTNVELEHTDVLGATRAAVAAEKLAVARPGSTLVVPDREFAYLAPGTRVVEGGAQQAVEAFLGREVAPLEEVRPPGRLEQRGDELRDGAHNPAGVGWLVERLPAADYVVVASILADKDADAMLRGLTRAGRRFVATRSSNPRSLPAEELAEHARRHFAEVEAVADPHAALARAHELGGPVLVTGSLYLLADLERSATPRGEAR